MEIKSMLKMKTLAIGFAVVAAICAVWAFVYVVQEKETVIVVKEVPVTEHKPDPQYKSLDEVVREAHRNLAQKMDEWDAENQKKVDEWEKSGNSKSGFGVPPF